MVTYKFAVDGPQCLKANGGINLNDEPAVFDCQTLAENEVSSETTPVRSGVYQQP